jgi:hypothetical protein
MDAPSSEVGYTSATTGRGDHEVHDRHVVVFDFKKAGKTNLFNVILITAVDSSGRAIWGVKLLSLAWWDCGFESYWEHGWMSVCL